MAWPPTPSAGYTNSNDGKGAIRWGTDGYLGVYIVKSIRPADVIENIYVENGTGIRTYRINLWQGREVEITVVDDNTIVAPAPNASITLADPIDGNTYSFHVIDNNYSAAAKQPGERVVKATCDWNIDNSGNVPAASTTWPN